MRGTQEAVITKRKTVGGVCHAKRNFSHCHYVASAGHDSAVC